MSDYWFGVLVGWFSSVIGMIVAQLRTKDKS